ncbi:MAG: type II toxin-antitoxin system HipA family toxin [Deltaproteobacteria bacterium]|nr:type II toxin-antitoxin system HipA family toxin [Deltaproteobacteria bacterium]
MTRYQDIARARVYLRGHAVGELEKRSPQSFIFAYSDEYLGSKVRIPIAHCFPLQGGKFESKELHPYFDNMILEGWLLERAERELHIDKKNRFALLMAVGREPIGAVSICPLDPNGVEIIPSASDEKEAGEEQSVTVEEDERLKTHRICPGCLTKSPKSSLYHRACQEELWGSSGRLWIRLDKEDPLAAFSKTIFGGSISGAQRKGLFALDEKKKELHANVGQADYILKPNGQYPELPANEHLTMAIAKSAGFRTPPFGIVRIEKLGLVYVVKRFDRIDGRKRLVEDMAQIIGEMTNDKYEGSYEKIAGAIKKHSEAPKLDLNELFRRIVFCLLTANGDMHLKNWMLIESEELDGNYELSPCYDFLNTRIVIPKEKMDSALPIMGRQNIITWECLKEFALKVLVLEPKFVESVHDEMKGWNKKIEELVPNSLLSDVFKKRYLEIVDDRRKLLSV